MLTLDDIRFMADVDDDKTLGAFLDLTTDIALSHGDVAATLGSAVLARLYVRIYHRTGEHRVATMWYHTSNLDFERAARLIDKAGKWTV